MMGFLGYALDDDSLLLKGNVLDTLANMKRSAREAFFQQLSADERNCHACFVAVEAIAKELRENSLFIASLRNEKLAELWTLYFDEATAGTRRVVLANENVVRNFKLASEKSRTTPELPFPPWLMYPLLQELENVVRRALASFLVELKLEEQKPNGAGSSSLGAGASAGGNNSGSLQVTPPPLESNNSTGGGSGGSKRLRLLRRKQSVDDPGQQASEVETTASDEKSVHYETSMHVRSITLNSGTEKSRWRERVCTLDAANKIIRLAPSKTSEAVEIFVLRCVLQASKSKPAEFSLTVAGFRYDFRAHSDAVAKAWVRFVSETHAEEMRYQEELVRKRTEILQQSTSSMLPPDASHYRTFAPLVVPRNDDDDDEQSSANHSSSEAVEEDALDDDAIPEEQKMPWSQPGAFLEASKKDEDDEERNNSNVSSPVQQQQQQQQQQPESSYLQPHQLQQTDTSSSSLVAGTPNSASQSTTHEPAANNRQKSFRKDGSRKGFLEAFAAKAAIASSYGLSLKQLSESPPPGAFTYGAGQKAGGIGGGGVGGGGFHYGSPPVFTVNNSNISGSNNDAEKKSSSDGVAVSVTTAQFMSRMYGAGGGPSAAMMMMAGNGSHGLKMMYGSAPPPSALPSSSNHGPDDVVRSVPPAVVKKAFSGPTLVSFAALPGAATTTYHQSVPFVYHGVPTNTNTNTNVSVDLPVIRLSGEESAGAGGSVDSMPSAGGDAGNFSPRTASYMSQNPLNLDDGDDDNGDSSNSFDDGGDRAEIMGGTSEQMLVRRQEIELKRKLHKSRQDTQHLSVRPLRDSGYAPVVDAMSLSPRSLANATVGRAREMPEDEFEDPSEEASLVATDPSEDSRFSKKEVVNGGFQEELATTEKLVGLADDFLESAKRYARVVVEEAFLEESKKTIKPVSPKGNVYVLSGIVLELVTGADKRFSPAHSFEMEAKFMGHQLKGFSALTSTGTQTIHVPLVAVMDFLGLRIVAYSALPVSATTIVYGPLHGVFHNRNKAFAAELARVARKLNLKESLCGKEGSAKRQSVIGGYGLQGHLAEDELFYVVQLADFFPCVRPQNKFGRVVQKGAEHVELFRPEFVLCYPKQLSSNAFKPWAKGMPDDEQNRRDIEEATIYLESVVVPCFAKDFTDLVLVRGLSDSLLRVDELMHEYGLNVRYTGMVLAQMRISNTAHMWILLEMIARVIKNEVRDAMRRKAAELKMVSMTPFRALVAAFLDVAFSSSESSEQFWSGTIVSKLESKFGVSANTWGDMPRHLKAHVFADKVHRLHLFRLVKRMLGLVCLSECDILVERYPKVVPMFTYQSVIRMEPIVREMDFADRVRGTLYQIRGNDYEKTSTFDTAHHFYSASVHLFKSALTRSPTNPKLLRNLGDVVFKLARLVAAVAQGKRNLSMLQLDPSAPLFVEARSYFVRAIKADSSDPVNFFHLANFLENMGLTEEAEEHYLQALKINPTHAYILLRYGHFLANTEGLYEVAEAFFEKAKACMEAASKLAKSVSTASSEELLKDK